MWLLWFDTMCMHVVVNEGVPLLCILLFVSLNVYLSLWYSSVGVSVCLFFSLGKVCEDKCAFLRWQLVLLLSGLLQQLFPHHSEHRTQQCPAEDLRGLVAG